MNLENCRIGSHKPFYLTSHATINEKSVQGSQYIIIELGTHAFGHELDIDRTFNSLPYFCKKLIFYPFCRKENIF